MAIVNVAGIDLPAPTEYKIEYNDIVNSGRNAVGDVIGDRISRKTKLFLSWKYLSNEDLNTLINIFETNFYNTVIYEYINGTTRTMVAYPSPQAHQSTHIDPTTGKIVWTDISINLIEK